MVLVELRTFPAILSRGDDLSATGYALVFPRATLFGSSGKQDSIEDDCDDALSELLNAAVLSGVIPLDCPVQHTQDQRSEKGDRDVAAQLPIAQRLL